VNQPCIPKLLVNLLDYLRGESNCGEWKQKRRCKDGEYRPEI
jgi:hypothetical protein